MRFKPNALCAATRVGISALITDEEAAAQSGELSC